MFLTIAVWLIITGLIGVQFYVIRNLLKKVEFYEDFSRELHTELEAILKTIKMVDIRGAFEADDEVGDTFIAIKNLVLKLEKFLREE